MKDVVAWLLFYTVVDCHFGNTILIKSICFQVRAETLTTMRVLAKFVGFVVSRPFGYDGYRNVLVDQKQSKIRNLVSLLFKLMVV